MAMGNFGATEGFILETNFVDTPGPLLYDGVDLECVEKMSYA
jgi:hypothetical protein